MPSRCIMISFATGLPWTHSSETQSSAMILCIFPLLVMGVTARLPGDAGESLWTIGLYSSAPMS